jgi:hypothetical protein
LTTRGFSTRKYAYFGEGEWWPNFLDGGITASSGIPNHRCRSSRPTPKACLSTGFQKIDAKWGLFLRANGASGTAVPIETSIAWGGIYNNPLERNKLDQVGLGLFWDKTNLKAVAQPARSAEMGSRTLLQLHPLQSLAVDPRLSALFRPCPETGRRPCRGLHDPNHGFLLTYCDRCESANTSP